jgi:hypothetical protein
MADISEEFNAPSVHWKWIECVPLKHRSVSTKLHGIISDKTAITAEKISNLAVMLACRMVMCAQLSSPNNLWTSSSSTNIWYKICDKTGHWLCCVCLYFLVVTTNTLAVRSSEEAGNCRQIPHFVALKILSKNVNDKRQISRQIVVTQWQNYSLWWHSDSVTACGDTVIVLQLVVTQW